MIDLSVFPESVHRTYACMCSLVFNYIDPVSSSRKYLRPHSPATCLLRFGRSRLSFGTDSCATFFKPVFTERSTAAACMLTRSLSSHLSGLFVKPVYTSIPLCAGQLRSVGTMATGLKTSKRIEQELGKSDVWSVFSPGEPNYCLARPNVALRGASVYSWRSCPERQLEPG